MRIRKNARLITSSSSSSFLVCQLNRSPWDVDSFSVQGELEDDIGVNGNLASSDSLLSVESMELSFEYVEKTLPPPPQPPSQLPIFDGRNRWKPPVQVGPPLPPIPTPPKKRGRPKKSASAAVTTTTATTNNNNNNGSSNPYEFYYYSGFGPSWGKRRGNKCPSTIIVGNESNNISNCYTAIINDVDESPSSSASHVMCEDDDRDDEDNKNIINNNNDSNIVVIDRVIEGELDYIEDDFDDDDDEDENLSGRRVRKPVKARSLKSLM